MSSVKKNYRMISSSMSVLRVLKDSRKNKSNSSQGHRHQNKKKKFYECANLIKKLSLAGSEGGRLDKARRGWRPMMNPQIVPNKHALYLLHFPCTGPTDQALCTAAPPRETINSLITTQQPSRPDSQRLLRTGGPC